MPNRVVFFIGRKPPAEQSSNLSSFGGGFLMKFIKKVHNNNIDFTKSIPFLSKSMLEEVSEGSWKEGWKIEPMDYNSMSMSLGPDIKTATSRIKIPIRILSHRLLLESMNDPNSFDMRDDGRKILVHFMKHVYVEFSDRVGIIIVTEAEERNPTQSSKKIFKTKMFCELFTQRFFNDHIKRGPISKAFPVGIQETLRKRKNIRSGAGEKKLQLSWEP
ncbi:hypothetical protein M9H77_02572 [Catharanthus roseus]|uniref:Uncharacterized protein n=1 Tax=Catharanthus roseus TaxID=4058 RepID=A0ACC0C8X2_CATRO|nr:hypothetical protein M9H77_02572 [Catharanthus roseus]